MVEYEYVFSFLKESGFSQRFTVFRGARSNRSLCNMMKAKDFVHRRAMKKCICI